MTMVEERVTKLEGAYEQVDQRLGDLTVAVTGLRTSTDAKFDALRTDMDARFDAQRAEISALRTDMDAKFEALRTSMDAKFDAQRAEISAFRVEASAFRAEVNSRFNNIVFSVSTIGVAIAGAIVFLPLRT